MTYSTPESWVHGAITRHAMADLARVGCGIVRTPRRGSPTMCFKDVVITVITPNGLPVGLCKQHARKYHDEGSLPVPQP